MNIDLTSIIIAIIGLSFFLVPVALDYLLKKKSSKKIEKELFRLAKSKNARITKCDVWRDSYAIGIGSDSRKLFYLKKQQDKNEEIMINLAEVKKCSISKTNGSIKGQHNRMNVNQVSLILTFLDSDKPEKKLAFYRKDQDQNLQGEIDLAEKWVSIINLKLL
ncbi:MAG TPA: hypothetical protein VF181_11565 [Balneolaceae bacterium]